VIVVPATGVVEGPEVASLAVAGDVAADAPALHVRGERAEGAALAICRARRPPGKEEVRDACYARERTDDTARRCAAAGEVARARIELATPRFSVVCSTN
jgi:hypothetical protein